MVELKMKTFELLEMVVLVAMQAVLPHWLVGVEVGLVLVVI